jgi:hypothetical protein
MLEPLTLSLAYDIFLQLQNVFSFHLHFGQRFNGDSINKYRRIYLQLNYSGVLFNDNCLAGHIIMHELLSLGVGL